MQFRSAHFLDPMRSSVPIPEHHELGLKPRHHECLAQVIRERRLKLGLSQEALAAKAKVHRTYVGMIERGERSPTCDVAYKLARALGVSLSSLIREAENSQAAASPALEEAPTVRECVQSA